MITQKFSSLLVLILFIQTSFDFNCVSAIGCYKCSTINNDTACIDPFQPGISNSSNNYYDPDCRAGLEGRIGLFPARYCLKVSGILASSKEQIVIRTCTVNKLLDTDSSYSSFTLKADDQTELNIVSGLIASCRDDGCNSFNLIKSNKLNILCSLVFFKLFNLVNKM